MESGRKFLRCLIKKDENEDLSDNAFRIVEAPIDFSVVDSTLQEIFKFIKLYHDTVQDLPTFEMLSNTFQEKGKFDEKAELEDIQAFTPHINSSFEYLKKEVIKEIHKITFNTLIQDASKINSSEFKRGKKILKGTKDALNYLLENSEPFFYESSSDKTESEMSKAAPDAIQRLEIAKENSLANYGVLSGIAPIDLALKGVKKKELLIIAGSVGECKTTLAMNYAYNAVIEGGFNVVFVTLEMDKKNVEDMLYCMHASNHSLQSEIGVNVTLAYDDILSGNLSSRQEAFFRYAVEDWAQKGMERKGRRVPYGDFTVWQPNTALTPSLLAAKLSYFNRISPVHLVVVDYPGLMSPDNQASFKNESAALNEIMKRLKQLALTFNDSEGLALICPFQINREGKKEAVKKTEKKEGEQADSSILTPDKPMYNTYHLSYANEAERSADYVIYTYLNDELRESNKIHIGGIKNRHGSPMKPFIAQTLLAARKIWHNEPSELVETGKVEEISL